MVAARSTDCRSTTRRDWTTVAVAVQIENNPLARPARNLSNADMVVEAPVEGDTTRFSAIFLCRATVG